MKTILVAGDVCLDMVGVPRPAKLPIEGAASNWRLTGETQTTYLLGGTLLMAESIKAALKSANVGEPLALLPEFLKATKGTSKRTLSTDEFLAIAERLKREEIVHSLLSLNYFPTSPGDKSAGTVRVERTYGYSGPATGDPTLEFEPPGKPNDKPDIIVLDDTGNRFRRTPEHWPPMIRKKGNEKTVVIYKLHKPLPEVQSGAGASSDPTLWTTVSVYAPSRTLVITSVEDLRLEDAPISRGLSWERTALDVVFQLLNHPKFAELRNCPHLIIRLGLDGAVYWQHNKLDGNAVDEKAWLIYDPAGIEGSSEKAVDGEMVGYGTVFTTAIVKEMASGAAGPGGVSLTHGVVIEGIKLGLIAARRLLRSGFGKRSGAGMTPRYPFKEVFDGLANDRKSKDYFNAHPIPIIPKAATADRGYWRLIDSIFSENAALLRRAVTLTATNSEPVSDDDEKAQNLLQDVPIAVFANALRTHDRREIENYRFLYTLMSDYTQLRSPPRPLSVAVFGPPGAGKSFGIEMVAKALCESAGVRRIETLKFNLSQYQTPDQLADAFHQVRDLVLKGVVPLVFFDEFDSSMGGSRLGWLRYFLAPMQDAEFLDRGIPHPIGQSIFVFAGGTCGTYAEFAEPFHNEGSPNRSDFQAAKGPDFLSRLRGTLDVPGLDLFPDFDPYGSVEAFPCEAATLLRRAGILAYQLGKKAPQLGDSEKKSSFRIGDVVLRALLRLPQFEHGNRSFEAMLDMSHLPGSSRFTPSLLPSSSNVGLHADPLMFSRMLATEYPFLLEERDLIAKAIHDGYRQMRFNDGGGPDDPSLKPWDSLAVDLRESNCEQADDIPRKLRTCGLWYRKSLTGKPDLQGSTELLLPHVETLAQSEHDRFVAEKRRKGWIAAADTRRDSKKKELLVHNFLFPWNRLSESEKDLDRNPVRQIPQYLAAAGYEIYKP